MRRCGAEADEEQKPFDHHLSHLAVHGFLHLIGYDHENDADAEAMEAPEQDVLAQLGIPNPYADPDGLRWRIPNRPTTIRATRAICPRWCQSGEVLRPTADGWLLRAIRTLFGWKAGSVRDDLQVVLDATTPDDAGFSAVERTVLRNILGLHERRIADVMVHRADIVAVKRDIPLGELMDRFESAGHSRFVVYNETLDDPVGIVHIRDLLTFMTAKARTSDTGQDQAQEAAARGPRSARRRSSRCRCMKPASSASCCMCRRRCARSTCSRRCRRRACIWRSSSTNYGGSDGLVSLEDIVEQIVGEIDDEHDSDEPPSIVRQPDNSFIADARASLDDVRSVIGEDFVTGEAGEEVETLGGYLVSHVGRLPVRGEVISGPGNYEVSVLDADPRRVKRLRIAQRKERPAPRAARKPPSRGIVRQQSATLRRDADLTARRRDQHAVTPTQRLRMTALAIILTWGWKRASSPWPPARCRCWRWRRSTPGRCCS